MEDYEFIIAVTAIACGTFLITVRMIISAIKWRLKQKGGQKTQVQEGNSLALGELEEIVRMASLEANQPIAARLDRVENNMRSLAEPEVTGGIREITLDDDIPVEGKTVGRRSRERG